MSGVDRGRPMIAASEGAVADAVATLRGNAADIVAAAVFAAAALSPTVLLGPVQILIGGAGAGLRAIDGRCLQPGRGAARPRGFVSPSEVPDAAHVGVTCLPAAIAALLASFGTLTFSQAVAPALDLTNASSKARHQTLKLLSRGGPYAMAGREIGGALVDAGGRLAGGILTSSDLESARPTVVPCTLPAGARSGVIVPWSDDEPHRSVDTQAIAVTDANGVVVVACYETPIDGVPVAELGLVAPFVAAPVRRGERRIAPGAALPAASPMALLSVDGVVNVGVAVAQVAAAESSLKQLVDAVSQGASIDEAIAQYRENSRQSGRVVGVARSSRGARAFG